MGRSRSAPTATDSSGCRPSCRRRPPPRSAGPGAHRSSPTAGPVAAPDSLHALTARELELVALVAQGLSNDDIAAQLYVSPLTAKTHVNRAMTELGARDRAQLVVIAYRTGLVRAAPA